MSPLRVLVVCEHASAKFGGEAALPLHYFRVLRKRGFRVWLITHARTRPELTDLFPGDSRIVYIEDTALHRLMWFLSRQIPARIAYFTFGFVARLAVQLQQRKLISKLLLEEGLDVIHQPMPVSPREPSLIYGFGVPVIIGPMNGGMNYPPGFRGKQRALERWILGVGRYASAFLNCLMPGKRRASLLLVANNRTKAALPPGVCRQVREIVENGVDLTIWQAALVSDSCKAAANASTTFIFMGRLVDWKAVDLLLAAFKKASERVSITLLIVGDGVERSRLQALALELGILGSRAGEVGRVFFHGWLSQEACAEKLRDADCLVLPSLLECGGAVVLEAMSSSKPVIATAWGGPLDYLDDGCGILVAPTSRESLIRGLEDAMVQLASSPAMRAEMGARGRSAIIHGYNWETKVDQVIECYKDAIREQQT